MMKKLALVLLLVPLAFAAGGWQPLSLLAVMASLLALALIFMVGFALDSRELKALAKEELIQVMATGMLVAAFAATEAFLQDTSNNLGGGMPVADAAKYDLAAVNQSLNTINSRFVGIADSLGKESSKSVFCSFSATSFSVSTCTGFAMLGGPLPLAFQATGTALAEIATLNALLTLGGTLIFTFFFPLGLFLRTFKLTRGAGGLLIGLAVTLYLVLPIGIIAVHEIIEKGKPAGIDAIVSVSNEQCNEYEFGNGNEEAAIKQLEGFITEPAGGGPSYLQHAIYYVLIEATLLLGAVVAIMAASVRAISALAGSTVDITPLTRLI